MAVFEINGSYQPQAQFGVAITYSSDLGFDATFLGCDVVVQLFRVFDTPERLAP
jgi:hypothetical protein